MSSLDNKMYSLVKLLFSLSEKLITKNMMEIHIKWKIDCRKMHLHNYVHLIEILDLITDL